MATMPPPLSLLADRFVCDVHGRVFDLATAEEVRVVERVSPRGDGPTRAAWRDECQQALEIHRFDRPQLVDYTEVGSTRCIEAHTTAARVELALAAASPIAIGLRLLPHAASAGVCAALDDDRVAAGAAVTRLYVRAAPGAGLTTWLDLLAREARLRGFVPLCPIAVARWPEALPLLRDRSIVLLCDRERSRDGERALAQMPGHRRGHPHNVAPVRDGAAYACLTLMRASIRVCAIVCPAPPHLARPAFDLAPQPPRALARAVVFDADGSSGDADSALRTSLAQLEALARAADGLPGRFVSRLLATVAATAETPRPRAAFANHNNGLLRVAEAAPPPFISSDPDQQDMLIADAWNLHGRHAAVIRDADALITRGRWAAAIRTLRAGVAAHQRRGRPQSAAVAALALARLHLTRCEIAEADRWCREAGELAARAPDDILAADALHWAGIIALENADLESSDRWLRMALIAAEQQGHRTLQQHIELSLARCLFWQGCINQMAVLCEQATASDDPLTPSLPLSPLLILLRARALRLTARRHLARGELSDAGAALTAAVEAIDSIGAAYAADVTDAASAGDRPRDAHLHLPDPERRDWAAALHVDRARLQLAIGDREKCAAHLEAAAATRPTLARLSRIRLIQMECDQADRTDDTRRRVSRLTRVFLQPRMPRLLRLRARYWIEPASRRSAELARFIDRYGETALSGRVASTHGPIAATHFRTLLQMSHEPGDERAVLTRICGFVRDQLSASYVAIHAAAGATRTPTATSAIAGGPPPQLACSGQLRLATPALAERVIDTAVLVAPRVAPDAIDAGAPIQANGETIGAVISRWIIDRAIDRGLTSSLLPAAADAAAPHVRAILDRAESASVSAFASAPASASTSAAAASAAWRSAPDINMLGTSAQMATLRETIARAADAPFHVLIEGESGSGKELVARALHQQSIRRIRRFCAVNCAALTDDLLEAELFGHARGAFTGALTERIGLFEEAHEGTLFLDEVGELSARAQAKLLRAMQDGEIRRLGENLPRRVQPRIVAATNRTLRDEAAAGRFRSDLLYRLDVVRIAVPPLRERVEDVPVLARAFWQQALSRTRGRATLDPETLAALARYDWPGNVRELQNVIARLAVQAPARGRIDPRSLPPPIRPAASGSPEHAHADASAATVPLDRARRAFEEQFVRAALARAGGQLGRAARDLGMTRQGLNKLLARLAIAMPTGESGTLDIDTDSDLNG